MSAIKLTYDIPASEPTRTGSTGMIWAGPSSMDLGEGTTPRFGLYGRYYGAQGLLADSYSHAPPAETIHLVSTPNTVLSLYGQRFWYERLHVIPTSEDVGTILSNTESHFYLYNAFRDNKKVLSDIVISGDGFAGTTIQWERDLTFAPSFYPLFLGAQRGEGFTFKIPADGDPRIDMDFNFTIHDGTPAPTFNVVGSRSILFPFSPQRPLDENIEFLTNLLEAQDGTETRISTRTNARQSFKMKYLIDQQDPKMFQKAQALVVGRSGAPIGVGMWQQTKKVGADLSPGDTTISIDTSGMDFRAGSYAVLWSNWDDTEIISVEAFDGTSITSAAPLEKSFSAVDTYCVPMQLCVAKDRPKINSYQNNVAEFQIEWESQETDKGTLADNSLYSTQYLGAPVMDDYMLMNGSSASRSFVSDFNTLDYGTGIRDYVSRKPAPSSSNQKLWDVETLEDAMALRKFFYWARGKQKSFWFPTNSNDLSVKGDTADGSLTLILHDTGYLRDIGINPPYNHIEIKLKNGTSFYREIVSGVNDIDAGTDTLQMSSSLGVEVLESDIQRVSFLYRARFDGDKLTIKHEGQGRVTAGIGVMGVKQ